MLYKSRSTLGDLVSRLNYATKPYETSKREFDRNQFFPETFLDVFFTYIEQLDNKYRTPEAHLTGSIRKWSLSMLPIEKSRDFDLLAHWNIANSMMKGLREYLINLNNSSES